MTMMVETQPADSSTVCLPMIMHVRVVTGTGGGPDKTILNSPRYLAALGYQSTCAYLRGPRDTDFQSLILQADAAEAPLEAVDDRGPFDLGVLRRLLSLCRQHDVKIWHGHDYKSNFAGLLLRRRHPMHLVTTVHGWGVRDSWRSALYRRIDKACLRHYDSVICVSDDLRDECLRVKVSPKRCRLISNGIDVEAFRRRLGQADAKARIRQPVERPLIGAVGRLSDEKGFDRLIRAVNRLIQSGIDLGLIIVGEGKQRPELQSLISDLDLDDHVQLLGHRTDIIDLYQAMDVFALSSLREGLPNAVLEALAMETPVVATRIAGVPRLIEDGRTGRLVEPDNVEELARAIQQMLSQPEECQRLAAAGRRLIEEQYSFRQRMQRVAQLYDELLAHDTEK